MSKSIVVPANLVDNFVGFIELSSMTTKRALDEVQVHRSAQEKAAALRPGLLEHMVKTKVVQPHQKEAADIMLGAHDTSLQLLKAATDKIAEMDVEIRRLKTGVKSAGDLGEGMDTGGGSNDDYNSLTSPMVGDRNSYIKESDKPLLRLIGK